MTPSLILPPFFSIGNRKEKIDTVELKKKNGTQKLPALTNVVKCAALSSDQPKN